MELSGNGKDRARRSDSPTRATEGVSAAVGAPTNRFRPTMKHDEIRFACPACDDWLLRVPRHAWMRLLLGSRYLVCVSCDRRFLRFATRMVRLNRRPARLF